MRRKLHRPARGLACFISAALAASAFGGTGTLTASVVVDTNCSISTNPVSFGSYDPIVANTTAALNATGAVNVTCVKGSTPSIALDLGTHASGSVRRMRHATVLTTFLTYELYKPPSTAPGTACVFPSATVWGSAGANLFSPGAAPSKNSRTFNVCGTVPAGQNVEVGTYSDTVTATVAF